MGENGFISYVDDTPDRVFAIVRFLGVFYSKSHSQQVLICQRAKLDASPSDAHGLIARRLRLEHFGFFELQQQSFASIRLAQGFIHDCPAAASHGTPCSFVNDYPVRSFSSGRKRYISMALFKYSRQDGAVSWSAPFN